MNEEVLSTRAREVERQITRYVWQFGQTGLCLPLQTRLRIISLCGLLLADAITVHDVVLNDCFVAYVPTNVHVETHCPSFCAKLDLCGAVLLESSLSNGAGQHLGHSSSCTGKQARRIESIFGLMYLWLPLTEFVTLSFVTQYLPFAQLVLRMFMGSSIFDILHGMAVAHLYYFLADVVPQVQGREVLHTPQFLIDRLGVGEYRPQAGNAAPQNPYRQPQAQQQQAAPQRGFDVGHQWGGGGQRLGRD